MIIYKITNNITKEKYIGQTARTLEERKNQHIKCHKREVYKDFVLYRSMRKYGIENFEWNKICDCNSREEMNEKEIFYIKEYDTKVPNGYNMTDGGCNNNPSIETRRKISNTIIQNEICRGKNNPMYGRKRPDVVERNKNNSPNLGKQRPDISIRMKNNNPMKDKNISIKSGMSRRKYEKI